MTHQTPSSNQDNKSLFATMSTFCVVCGCCLCCFAIAYMLPPRARESLMIAGLFTHVGEGLTHH